MKGALVVISVIFLYVFIILCFIVDVGAIIKSWFPEKPVYVEAVEEPEEIVKEKEEEEKPEDIFKDYQDSLELQPPGWLYGRWLTKYDNPFFSFTSNDVTLWTGNGFASILKDGDIVVLQQTTGTSYYIKIRNDKNAETKEYSWEQEDINKIEYILIKNNLKFGNYFFREFPVVEELPEEPVEIKVPEKISEPPPEPEPKPEPKPKPVKKEEKKLIPNPPNFIYGYWEEIPNTNFDLLKETNLDLKEANNTYVNFNFSPTKAIGRNIYMKHSVVNFLEKSFSGSKYMHKMAKEENKYFIHLNSNKNNIFYEFHVSGNKMTFIHNYYRQKKVFYLQRTLKNTEPEVRVPIEKIISNPPEWIYGYWSAKTFNEHNPNYFFEFSKFVAYGMNIFKKNSFNNFNRRKTLAANSRIYTHKIVDNKYVILHENNKIKLEFSVVNNNKVLLAFTYFNQFNEYELIKLQNRSKYPKETIPKTRAYSGMIRWPDGIREYYKDGELHREHDKPAVIYPEGDGRLNEYWEYGKRIR